MNLLDILALETSPARITATGEPVPRYTRCATCGTTAYGPCGARNATSTRSNDGTWVTTSRCNCGALTWRDEYRPAHRAGAV